MGGPLDGVVVLEIANYIAGPYAGLLLVDLGAEVIKVEHPDGGDPFRAWDLGGDQPTFWAYNRGKKSLTLDLRAPGGVEVFYRLAERADVVLENLRPGAMERLGVGWEQLRARNPRLIYCSVTGFGPTGPYRDRPAYDGVGQSLSGLLSLLTPRDRPQHMGPNFSDSLAGAFGAYGILAALLARERTGRGQRVDTSLVGATIAFLIAPATEALATGTPPGPLSRPSASQTYAWVAADGLPLTVHLSAPQKFWEGLLRAVERLDLLEDERFRTRAARRRNYLALRDELAPVFATRPRAEWLARLEAEGVPHAPIYDLCEVFADPQVRHMGLEIAIPRPGRPPVRTVRGGVDFSDTAPPLPGPPPELGEHTEALLARAGYTAAEIATLRARRVI
jgi:formyl-CoA transferase